MLRCPRLQVCGVAVSVCRWPGQPRLLRDPPYEKDYKTCLDRKCVAPARWRVSFACVGVSG